jgi:hypothetical protein
MARLSKHLQYFVNKKISEDAEWRGVEIILSGHDVLTCSTCDRLGVHADSSPFDSHRCQERESIRFRSTSDSARRKPSSASLILISSTTIFLTPRISFPDLQQPQHPTLPLWT